MLDPVRTDLTNKIFLYICTFFGYQTEKQAYGGFPGGPVVKDLPANTGDVGSIPGTWRTPYTVGQPSPGATTPEPAHHRACALQQEKPRDEKALHNQESSPYSLQLEKACVAKRLSTAKKTPKTPNKYMHNIPTHAFCLHTTHLTCSVVGQPVFAPWGPPSSS